MTYKQKLQKIIACGMVSAIMLVLFLVGALGYFEHMGQDRLYRDFSIVHPDIIVIGIDEETLTERMRC